ncbi:MAG: RlmE family RNA methyltransferase [Thermoplasmatales archaeon]|nr:MAG: RlmE family RNA methyltransferase [Thermoplasmatales archaeon]
MTRWYREKKREHYYKEANRFGYRARSAFKLKQIHKRFDVFSKNDIVIDLGAAPGGWSQVAKEFVGSQGTIIGIDILPVKPLDNIQFIQGDITDQETLEELKQILNDAKADVVLSDMSPDISGNYSVDQARSLWLCERALELADKVLHPGGTFVCKIFEGEDTKEFMEKVKRRFTAVKKFSPDASRKRSSEIYIIAKSLKKTSP